MPGRLVAARIGRIKPVNIGEQYQRICSEHLSGARGQTVIIAVADFIRGDGIILVDDWHAAMAQNGFKGEPRIERVRLVA